MSLKLAADHLKNQGRGPDTELVHMSKNELKGLQALAMSHGGSLTINPHTGLVEAGFLEKILPSLAGAAVGYFTGMPLLGAAVGGGLGYAETGNLQSGLMAGLGAYGGASLLGGIEGIGASELVNAAPFDETASISQLAETDPIGAIAKGGDPTAVSQVYDNGANLPGSQLQSGLKAVQQNPMGFLKGNAFPLAMAASPLLFSGLGSGNNNNQMPVAGKGPANPMGLQQYSNFVAQGPTQPNPYYQAAYPNYQQNAYVPKYADGGDVSSIAPPSVGPVEQLSRDNATGNNQMFPQAVINSPAFSSATNTPIASNVLAPASDTNVDPYTGAERFAAGGQPKVKDLPMGDVGIYQETDPDLASLDAYSAARKKVDKLNAKYQTGIKSALPTAQPLGALNLSPVAMQQMQQAQQQPTAEMSSGGLGSYSDGGHLLKGPGDGMSDDIPAKIGQHQPARLADGEFVVPADVVSHLGNGSTEAGAKQLYSMMDKIRKARTGKAKQAPEVKADKFLPK